MVIGESTRAKLPPTAVVEALGELTVKGRSGPVVAYRLLGLGAEPTPTGSVSNYRFAPVAGRSADRRAGRGTVAGHDRTRRPAPAACDRPVRRAVPARRLRRRAPRAPRPGWWPGPARVLGDPESAEDAVQEAFLRAWAACASFDPAAGPTLLAWLSTITRNVVVDLVRARAARPQLPRTEPDPATTARARRHPHRHRAAAHAAARRAGHGQRRAPRRRAAHGAARPQLPRRGRRAASCRSAPCAAAPSTPCAACAGPSNGPISRPDRLSARTAGWNTPAHNPCEESMKWYAPILTLVVVAALGAVLFVVNSLAAPRRRPSRRPPRRPAAPRPTPAVAGPRRRRPRRRHRRPRWWPRRSSPGGPRATRSRWRSR